MNCLILAAGYGSRLRAISESKPLTPVAGVPLIERVVIAARAAGADEFVVVTGHDAERLEAFLAGLRSRLGVELRSVPTADWDRPNGFSVLAGADTIAGEYLLLMSDHLFDPDIARDLLARGSRGAAVTLAVDRRLSGAMLDIEDATKVEVDASGRIVRIGKTLDRYNAIDTGIFLATPELAQAIRAAVADGASGSLSDGMQHLADRGQALTMDVRARTWIDVDDPPRLVLAEDWLRVHEQAC
ncbi:MAG TPA: NTP transferase domain-containing protein [Allosphingosinicella sp.]|jgi:choline kinase|nr:NTP transferase domain-containing protein [Allosphingosinicella sp.]